MNGKAVMALLAMVLAFMLILGRLAVAEPQGGTVTAGSAAIDQATPGVTNITQFSDRVIINWERYGIGIDELVRYLQPGDLAVALNRVTGLDPSLILGSLQANGRIFIINPNGILFGPQSRVDVGGLMASTLDMKDGDFLDGNYVLLQNPERTLSYVVNRGQIRASDGGFVVLVAPLAGNEGTIIANLGHIVLGAGKQAVLNFDGQGLFNFVLPAGSSAGGGGNVVMTTEACADALAETVNHLGYSDAGRVIERDGQVVLLGAEGTAVNSGTLRADGAQGRDAGTVLIDSTRATVAETGSLISAAGAGLSSNGGNIRLLSGMEGGVSAAASGSRISAVGGENGNGGFIEVSGGTIYVEDADIDASAPAGTAGTLLLDPWNVTIGTAAQAGGAWSGGNPNTWTPSATGSNILYTNINGFLNANTNVIVSTTGGGAEAGNITLNAASVISRTAGAGTVTLTLNAGGGLNTGGITLGSAIGSTSATWPLNVVLNAPGGAVAVNAAITTNGGSLTSTGTTFNNTAAITTAGGNVDLSGHTGAVTIGASINTGAGSFSSAGTTFNNTGGAITTANGTVNLAHTAGVTIGAAVNTGGASFGSAGTTFTNSGTVTTGGGAGNILHSASVLIGNDINAGAGTLIISGTDISRTGGTLTAGSLGLTAASGVIGTADENIQTSATILAATAAGNIYINEASGVDIGSVGGVNGLTTTAANGNIRLITAGALTSSQAVSANGSGTVTLSATGSDLTTGASVSSASGAITLMSGGNLATGGGISTTSSPVNLQANNNVTLGAGAPVSTTGAITIQADFDNSGAGTLTTNAGSVIGGAGTTGTITLEAASISLGADVRSSGSLYLAPSTAASSIGLGTAATGTFKLDDTELGYLFNGFSLITIGHLAGSGAVDVRAVTFHDPVTIQSPVGAGSITVNGLLQDDHGSGTLTLNGPGATTTLNSDIVTNGVAISISDSVLLGAATVTLNTASGAPAGAGISIAGTTNSTGGARNLVLNAGTGGNIALTGAAGGSSPLGVLTVSGANTVTTAAVSAASISQTSGNGLTTFGGAVSTSGIAGIVLSGSGFTFSSSASIAGGGPLSITSDNINFNGGSGTVSGTGQVTLQPSSDATTVGVGTGALGTLQLTTPDIGALRDGFGGVTIGRATGTAAIDVRAVTFSDPVTIQSAGAGGQVSINGTLASGSNPIVLTADTMNLNADIQGISTILLQPGTAGRTIGIGDGASGGFLLNTAGIGHLQNGFTQITIGRADGSGAVDVRAVTFNDPVIIRSPAAPGSITVNGLITGADNASITLGPAGTLTTLNAGITTSGNAITLLGPLSLGAAGTIQLSSGGGQISINGAVTGAGADFSLSAGTGNVDITSSINTGGGDFSSTGNLFNNTGGSITTGGGSFTLQHQGPITIGALLDTGAGSVTLDSVVSTTVSATGSIVTTSGNVIFGSVYGGTALLSGNITTGSGNLSLLRATRLGGPVTLATSSGTISFGSTLDGTVAGAQNLTVNAGTGSLVLSAAAGSDVRLGALTIGSAGNVTAAAISAASITQTAGSGTTTFNGALNANPGSIDLTGTNFTFNNQVATGAGGNVTVNNSGLLSLSTSSGMTLGGAFLQNGAGPVSIGCDITSGGNITFTSPVTLTGTALFNSSLAGGNITFWSTVDGTAAGAQNLMLNAGTGDIALSAALGGTTAPGALMILNAHDLTAAAAIQASSISQSAGSGTTSFIGAVNTSGLSGISLTGSAFSFNSTVTTTGGGPVTIANSSLLSLANGQNWNLSGAFTQSGSGPVSLGGNITTANGNISLAGATTLTSTVALSAGTGAFSGQALTAGANDLTVTANGISFQGGADSVTGSGTILLQPSSTGTSIGIAGASGTLQISAATIAAFAAGLTRLTIGRADGSHLITVNAVTFKNPVLLQAPLGGGSITVNGQITGNGPVTLDGSGATTTLNAGITTLGNPILISDSVLVGAGGVLLDTTNAGAIPVGANINIAGTTDSTPGNTYGLTFRAGTSGNVVLSGNAGSTTRLGTLTITSAGDVTTASIRASSIVQSAGSGTTTFNGGLDTSAVGGIALTGNIFNLNGPVTTTGSGPLTVTNGGLLTIAAAVSLDGAFTQNGVGAVTASGGIVTTNDNITFSSALSLSGPAVFNAGTATITTQGITAGANDLTFTADGIDFLGPAGSITGSGVVTLQPSSDSTSIGVAGGGGTMQITAAELAALQDGFTGIMIGRAAGSGLITINAVTFNDPVAFMTPAGTGSIVLDGPLTGSGNASVFMDCGPSGMVTLNAGIVTAENDIMVAGNAVIGEGCSLLLSTGGAGAGNINVMGTVNGTAGGVAENLQLLAGTGNITVTGMVGGTAPLNNLAITSANNVDLPAAALTGALNQAAGTGTTTISGAVSAASLNMASGGFVLNGTLSSAGTTSFAGDLTTTAPIISVGAFTETGNATLGAGITTSNSDLGISGNLVISDGSSVQLSTGSGAGNILVGGTTDGVAGGGLENLTLLAGSGDVTLTGAVGSLAPLRNLSITSAANVGLASVNLTGSLSQASGTGTTTLGGAAGVGSLNMTAAGFVVNGLVTSAGAVALTGDVLFNQGITTTGPGAITISGTATLGADAAFSTNGAAGDNISFSGSIDGAHGLSLDAGSAGLISVGGPVGALGALTNLTVADSNGASFSGPVSSGTVSLSSSGGTISMNGLLTATSLSGAAGTYGIAFNAGGTVVNATTLLNTGNVCFGNDDLDGITFAGGLVHTAGPSSMQGTLASTNTPIQLGALTINGNSAVTSGSGNIITGALTMSDGAAGSMTTTGGSIAIGGTVNGTSGGNPENLTLAAGAGNVTVTGAVGSTARINNLTIASANNVNLNSVSLEGSLVQSAGTGTTTLGGAISAGSLTMTSSNFSLMGPISTSGPVSMSGAVLLGADLGISSAGSNISFLAPGTLDGARTLTLDAGSSGLIAIAGAIGSVTPLNELRIANSGGTTMAGAVNSATVTVVNTSGTVTFNGALAVGNLSALAGGYNLAFNGGGTVTNAASLLNTGNVQFGNITFAGGVTHAAGTSSLQGTLNTANSPIVLGSTLFTGNATVNSGAGSIQIASLIMSDGVTGALNTTGGAITVTGNINGTSGGAAENLTLAAGTGNITLGGTVGGTAPLNNLTITNANNVGISSVYLDGALTQTAGSGTTILGGIVNVGSLGMTGNAFAVDGSLSCVGSAAFNGAIRTTGPIVTGGTFSLTGNAVLGNSITTNNNNLSVTGNIVIAEGATIQLSSGGGGGNITVGGTVDGTSGGSPENLNLLGGTGNVSLAGTVGGSVAPGNIAVLSASNVNLPVVTIVGALTQSSGSGTTTLGGAVNAGSIGLSNDSLVLTQPVTAAGTITLTGAVSLSSDLTVTSTGGGNITVNGTGTINGASALTLNAGSTGRIAVSGAIGSAAPLNSLTVANSGGAVFNGAVSAGSVSVSNTSGSVIIYGALETGTLYTEARPYGLALNGGGTVSGFTTLMNTGSVSFGNDDTDSLTFTDGLTHTTGASSIQGTLNTSGAPVSLGATTLAGRATINSASGNIRIGSLILSSGSSGLFSSAGGSINVDGTTEGLTTSGTPGSLVFQAGTGPVTLTGGIGSSVPVGDISVLSASGVNLPQAVLAGGLTVSGVSGTTTLNGRFVTGSNVAITTGQMVFAGNTSSINAGQNNISVSITGGSLAGGQDSLDLSAYAVDLSATGGIGSAENPLSLAASVLNARAAGGSMVISEAHAVTLGSISASGNISISSVTGDMTVNSVTAPSSGTVTLASGGSMLRGGTGASNITAGTASLSSSTGIGSSTEALRTTVGVLSASAVNGSVYIRETDGVLVNALSCGLAGTMSLEAGGSILDGNASVVNVSGGSGSLSAVGNIGSSSDALETSVGSLSATALGGSIFIDESDDITLRSVTGGVDVYVTTHSDGTITVNSVSAGNLLSLVVLGGVRAPGAGSILADGTVGVNVSAPSGHLVARGDIGTSSSALRTSLGTLDASAPNGSVYISEADTLLVNTLSAGTNASVTCATGNMVLNTLTAGGRASLTAPGGTVSGGTGSTANVTSSSVVLGSRGDTGSSGNYLRISSGALDATCTEGSLYVRNLSSGSMSLGDVSAGQDIRLEGTGDFSLGSVRAVRDAYLTLSSGSVFSGTPGRTNLSSGRDARIVVGGVIGLSGTPFGVNIPGVLSVSASGSIGGYSVVINGPNNLVLLNQPPGRVLDNSIAIGEKEGGGGVVGDVYLQAVSNADNPFIANVPGYYTLMLLRVMDSREVNPAENPIMDAPYEKGLYLTPLIKRGE
jgi:filamentous hemagglutinin family protein